MGYFAEKILLPLADKIARTKIVSNYDTIKTLRGSDELEIRKWQNERLKELIDHAYNNTLYYRKLFDRLKLSPSDIKTIDDLVKIPPLTKEIIRANYSDLIPSNIDSIHYKRAQTGGSTAEPLRYRHDINSWSYCTANTFLNWGKIGYRLGDKYIALGSSSIIPDRKPSLRHKLFYRLKGKVSFSAIDMSPDVLNNLLTVIRKNKIRYIYGYATALYLFAKYCKESSINIPYIKGLISTSEVLLPEYKELIEETFNCPVLDAYGAGDGGITAFKFDEEYFEVGYNCVIETDKLVNDRSGELYLTDLLNLALPFIRYKVGDGGELSRRDNYNGQALDKLYGRIPNIIPLENGKTLIAPGFTVLFSGLEVKSYKIVKTGFNQLTIRIIKDTNYSSIDEETIRSSFAEHAGKDCEIIIEIVSKFNDKLSGKRDYFIT